MPMGRMNAPAVFIRILNNLFVEMLDKVVVCLNDVVIYSTKAEEHFKLLEKVFIHLCKYTLYC